MQPGLVAWGGTTQAVVTGSRVGPTPNGNTKGRREAVSRPGMLGRRRRRLPVALGGSTPRIQRFGVAPGRGPRAPHARDRRAPPRAAAPPSVRLAARFLSPCTLNTRDENPRERGRASCPADHLPEVPFPGKDTRQKMAPHRSSSSKAPDEVGAGTLPPTTVISI